MALINSAGNLRSLFPGSLDTWTPYRNGQGLDNVINAEIWNKLETAILRTEQHCKSLCHVIGPWGGAQVNRTTWTARFRLTSAGQTWTSGMFTYGLYPSDFHRRNVSSIWHQHYVNVYHVTQPGEFVAEIFAGDKFNTELGVRWRSMDLTTALPTGDYIVSLSLYAL